MALRSVKSLNPEAWEFLVDCLKKGPSEKHKEFTRKAIERASKFKVIE